MAGSSSAVAMAKAIQLWPVQQLRPYERNARTHSEEQVNKIAASIVEFGFTNPILVDGDAGIIAGHGRLMAARKLGMTEVPVIELTHLGDAQKRAYILADNRLALDAGWNEELLAQELADLKEVEFDISTIGFTDAELAELLPDVRPGEMPELPSGEKPPFEQITFTLHSEQAEQVREALRLALGMGDFPDSLNENKNGNALARVCELFIGEIVPRGE